MVIDYDRAAADYEASLVTKLRGHGAGNFLENWVPDPDPVLGIVNMIEAAWTDGRDEVELLVARRTLDASGLERLKGLAAAIAEIRVVGAGEQHRLQVRRAAERVTTESRQPTARPKARGVRERRDEAARKDVPALQPMLAAALEAETASFTHEGQLGSDSGAVSLAVREGGIIVAARHTGVKPETRRRLVELMCREVEGRTVQDASDHAAVLVIHRLRRRADSRPAAGILLAATAGTEVVAALEMLRAACRKYQEQSGSGRQPNFFEMGPSVGWRDLPAPEKLRRAADALGDFCRVEGKPASVARVAGVEKDIHGHEIRVIIQMDAAVTGEAAPFFLRRLERFLKENVEGALQVYLEPWKDKNVLRRL